MNCGICAIYVLKNNEFTLYLFIRLYLLIVALVYIPVIYFVECCEKETTVGYCWSGPKLFLRFNFPPTYLCTPYIAFILFCISISVHFCFPLYNCSFVRCGCQPDKPTPSLVTTGRITLRYLQDCLLQKEARVCVSNAFVIEDSKF